jgi:ankyrin repeat protein
MHSQGQAPAILIKTLFDAIKKGELELVKAESERAGINIGELFDENYKHNGIFYATLIKDDNQCMKMVDYLINSGADPAVVDSLSQTALFYASREGKH